MTPRPPGSTDRAGPAAAVRPVSPSALTARLVRRALTLVDGARPAGCGVRVGVDAAVVGDGTALADDLADALRSAGATVLRVRQSGFLLPRSQRLELGPRDPLASWERWYDDAGLRREVLDPLGPGGALRWVPSLRDPVTDRSTRAARVPVQAGAVALVDGRFLLRPELVDGFDLVVHLQTSPPALTRRVGDADEQARVGPSWQRYVELVDPATRADVVVRYDDPRHPAVVTD
jgi:hypothetical protein